MLGEINVAMAIDSKKDPVKPDFNRATTEEHEKAKLTFANSIAKDIITEYSPEDRADVFNMIRRSLEEDLRNKVNSLANQLEADSAYFEALKNLVY